MDARAVKFVPVLTATPDYSDADLMGGVNELANVLPSSSGAVKLVSIAVVDKAKTKGAFDLLFFNALPTVASADNAALDLTAAEMADKFVGRVSFAAADYDDTANSSEGTKRSIDLVIQGSPGGTNDLWCVLQAQGTLNYASATDLTITLGFEQYR